MQLCIVENAHQVDMIIEAYRVQHIFFLSFVSFVREKREYFWKLFDRYDL